MNNIRQTLIDPSDRSVRERDDLRKVGQVILVGGTIGEVISAIGIIVGVMSYGNHPNFGIATIVNSLCGFFASREVYIVGKNLENMMMGNIFERTLYSINAENFTNGMTKNTLILHRFSKIIAQSLENNNGPY